MNYVIAYDIGSTGNKTCLYRLDSGLELLAEAAAKYPLSFVENGGVEQNPDDWWESMRLTTAEVLRQADISGAAVSAISFCSQMQGLVLVGKDGKALRPAMSYMDKRATKQFDAWRSGFISVAGINIRKLLVSLAETGVAAASAKDPVFRYAWVREKEPEIFRKIHKWLDVKDYLILRATGHYVSSQDSAFGSLLYNTKKNRWSRAVCDLHGVKPEHLAQIVQCTDEIGTLTEAAAAQLGLCTGCRVFAGGGDSSLIGIGAGCTRPGETHVYIGTSGWVSTVVDRQLTDIAAMIASVTGAIPGHYNYFAEMETSGKCIEWVRDKLLGEDASLEHMVDMASRAPAGSNGVIFMPWLLGNRCPFEDADCRGGFFNISLTTEKHDLIRAVLEGILFHKRWMLECQKNKVRVCSEASGASPVIRFVGGGARSALICQMLADILNMRIERTEKPQNAGAMGAAILMSFGLGHIASLQEAGSLIKVDSAYTPDPLTAAQYNKNYAVFKRLYYKNKKNFSLLNKK